jgi:hypothetical protein
LDSKTTNVVVAVIDVQHNILTVFTINREVFEGFIKGMMIDFGDEEDREYTKEFLTRNCSISTSYEVNYSMTLLDN